jgi:GTP-binding protein Era
MGEGTEPRVSDPIRCGLVAIVGRPNVGKSTYLNYAVGQKLSITSRKPQTTRYQLLGVKTSPGEQIVFIDTPGLQMNPGKALNRSMNSEVERALVEVDVALMFVEALSFTRVDRFVAERLMAAKVPVIVAVNKIDRVKNKELLLPFLQELADATNAEEIVPISALNGDNIDALERCISQRLPLGPALFPDDQVTDKSERFLIAEILREKLIRGLGDELPHSVSVVIEAFETDEKLVRISAVIWVERESQKPLVIGKGGSRLKQISIRAREDMEALLDKQVHLQSWVKVKESWSSDALALRDLGF